MVLFCVMLVLGAVIALVFVWLLLRGLCCLMLGVVLLVVLGVEMVIGYGSCWWWQWYCKMS